MSTANVHSYMDSPIGPLLLVGREGRLTGLFMNEHKGGPHTDRNGARDDAAFKSAREQLTAYFAGELREFALVYAGAGTSFQQRVWSALCEIPYGAHISYGELARRIGQPGAARAVGLANGQNPISIIVPCHRVIGARPRHGVASAWVREGPHGPSPAPTSLRSGTVSMVHGSLTGYGGGIEAKRWLLAHEAENRGQIPTNLAFPS